MGGALEKMGMRGVRGARCGDRGDGMAKRAGEVGIRMAHKMVK